MGKDTAVWGCWTRAKIHGIQPGPQDVNEVSKYIAECVIANELEQARLVVLWLAREVRSLKGGSTAWIGALREMESCAQAAVANVYGGAVLEVHCAKARSGM
jgi:hypothetical protein